MNSCPLTAADYTATTPARLSRDLHLRSITRTLSLSFLLLVGLLGGPAFASSRTILMGVTNGGELRAYGIDGLPGEEQYTIAWQDLPSKSWSGLTTHAGKGVLFYVFRGQLLKYHVVGTSAGLKVTGPHQTISNRGFENVNAITTDGESLLWLRDKSTGLIDLYHYTISGTEKRVSLDKKFPAQSRSGFHFAHLDSRTMLYANQSSALIRPYRLNQEGDVSWPKAIEPVDKWSAEMLAANGSVIFFVKDDKLHYRTHYTQLPKTFSGTNQGWSGTFKCLFTIPCAELPIVSQRYTVNVKTADVSGAGTDDSIGLTFVGTAGTSKQYWVDQQTSFSNATERNQTDTFSFVPVGSIQNIGYVKQLMLYKWGTAGQQWKCDTITVIPHYSPRSIFRPSKEFIHTTHSPQGKADWYVNPDPPPAVVAQGISEMQLEDSFIYLMEYANALASSQPVTSGKEYQQKVSNEVVTTNASGFRNMTDFGISFTYNQGGGEVNVGVPQFSVSGHLRNEIEVTNSTSDSKTDGVESLVISTDKVTAEAGKLQFKVKSLKVKTEVTQAIEPSTYEELIRLRVVRGNDSGSTGYTFPKDGPKVDTRTWNKAIAPVFVRVKSKGEYDTLVQDLQRRNILTGDAISAAQALER
jgi:hypothetical protein